MEGHPTIVLTEDQSGWTFWFPRVGEDAAEALEAGIDLMEEGRSEEAEALLRELVEALPEFLDARHHLAMVLDRTARKGAAFETWQEAVSIATNAMPDHFSMQEHHLEWGRLGNRPFLRVYHSLGLQYLEQGDTEEALSIFTNIVSLNPNDNQGVRALIVGCCFRLHRPDRVLRICDQYPDDGMEQLLYGRVLALLQLGREQDAELALDRAFYNLPLVAQELTKQVHRPPTDFREGYVTHGGEDQAHDYWIHEGQHWEATLGAIGFVRKFLRRKREG